MNNVLFLRLFVEVSTEKSASEIAKKIISLINKFVKVENQYIQKYWKITEYYEIFFKLSSLNHVSEDYQYILTRLGSGWENFSGFSIWNFGDEKKFVIDEVKWAEIRM